MDPIQCKRFDMRSPERWRENYDGFFAYGPGAFDFMDWHDGYSIIILVPGSKAPIRCRVKQEGTNGGQDEHGWWHTWDGDLEKPTLRASIGTSFFHGWLTNGVLTLA